MNKPQESRHPSPSLWHPRYWFVWAAVSLLYVFSLLPMRLKQSLGSVLGRVLYRAMKSRAEVAKKNLHACFPDWSSSEVENVARQTFVEVSKTFMDSLHLWSHPLTNMIDKTEFLGLEHVREAESRGKGVLLIGAHYTLLDVGMLLAGSCVSRPGYMYRANNNPVLEWMMERGRRRHYKVEAFDKFQWKEMSAFLKAGGQVAYACDQDYNDLTKFFVPFFAERAPCINGPTLIAKKTGATVVFFRHCRTPDGYRVEFSPIQHEFGKDAEEDARAWTDYIETTLREYPEQYFWFHKRFKTRPEGSTPIY